MLLKHDSFVYRGDLTSRTTLGELHAKALLLWELFVFRQRISVDNATDGEVLLAVSSAQLFPYLPHPPPQSVHRHTRTNTPNLLTS